jgi:hypothetical protein
LSSPHLEASPATTFRTCSSPAPTQVKPQPAPAILSQESVHTMLSITHHTRKRPSTGPRTTHGPQFHATLIASGPARLVVPPPDFCRPRGEHPCARPVHPWLVDRLLRSACSDFDSIGFIRVRWVASAILLRLRIPCFPDSNQPAEPER